MNEFNENNNQFNPIEPQAVIQENQQTQYATYQNIAPIEEKKGMAIASMVLGIVSIVSACCVPIIGVVCGIVGLILGIINLTKKQAGKGMAITGVILSGLGFVLALVAWILYASVLLSMPDFMNEFNKSFDFGDFYDM